MEIITGSVKYVKNPSSQDPEERLGIRHDLHWEIQVFHHMGKECIRYREYTLGKKFRKKYTDHELVMTEEDIDRICSSIPLDQLNPNYGPTIMELYRKRKENAEGITEQR